MHGVIKPLEFPFKVNGQNGNYTIGISSRLTLKRSDFGVATQLKHTSIENFLSDDVTVEIDFWTRKRKKPLLNKKIKIGVWKRFSIQSKMPPFF